MSDIRNIERVMHYCCHKILPLVYDDSLSYYEVLCKLINKMNEMIEDINDNFYEYFKEYMGEVGIDLNSRYISSNHGCELFISTEE